MQAHSRDASHPGKNNKDTAGGSDEKPVPDATGIHRLIRSPAAVQAACNVVSSNAVAAGFGRAASLHSARSSAGVGEPVTGGTPRSLSKGPTTNGKKEHETRAWN